MATGTRPARCKLAPARASPLGRAGCWRGLGPAAKSVSPRQLPTHEHPPSLSPSPTLPFHSPHPRMSDVNGITDKLCPSFLLLLARSLCLECSQVALATSLALARQPRTSTTQRPDVCRALPSLSLRNSHCRPQPYAPRLCPPSHEGCGRRRPARRAPRVLCPVSASRSLAPLSLHPLDHNFGRRLAAMADPTHPLHLATTSFPHVCC